MTELDGCSKENKMNNKILVVGNTTTPHGAEALIVRALERANYDVTEVFYPTYRSDYGIFNDTLDNTIKRVNPGLVICGKVMGLDKDIISYLKKTYGVPIIQITFDLMQKLTFEDRPSWWHPQIEEGGFDWVFGSSDNKEEKETISKFTSKYSCLREGVDLELHKPIIISNDKITEDVAFTGSPYNDFRNEMITSMTNDKRFKFKHYTKSYLNELRDIASYTKMSIGTNYSDDIQGYWSARTFENMAVGFTFLTPNIPGMKEEGLIDGKTCVFYDTRNIDDLKEKVMYYKDNLEECNKIRDNGIKLVFERHTFDERLKEMFKVLKKKKVI